MSQPHELPPRRQPGELPRHQPEEKARNPLEQPGRLPGRRGDGPPLNSAGAPHPERERERERGESGRGERRHRRSRELTLPATEMPRRPPLWQRLLALVLIAGLMSGVIWYVTTGAEKFASEEEAVQQGLHSLARDLWRDGTAAEMGSMPAGLTEELVRLSSQVKGPVDILVTPSMEAGATHDIAYMEGRTQVLLLGVHFDGSAGRVKVLRFLTGAAWQKKPGSGAAAAEAGTRGRAFSEKYPNSPEKTEQQE